MFEFAARVLTGGGTGRRDRTGEPRAFLALMRGENVGKMIVKP